jgi:ATP/ADP translocase
LAWTSGEGYFVAHLEFNCHFCAVCILGWADFKELIVVVRKLINLSLCSSDLNFQKTKPKMGMVESAKFLLTSRYIRDLATLVVAYGISINLVEVTWKSKLKAQVCVHLVDPCIFGTGVFVASFG